MAYGGTLHQHLPDLRRLRAGTSRRPASTAGTASRWSPARWPPRSPATAPKATAGRRSTPTTTRASPTPAALTVTGWADDGVIEAVEDPAQPFVLGVQWHPEEAGERRIFESLVEAARTELDRPRPTRRGGGGPSLCAADLARSASEFLRREQRSGHREPGTRNLCLDMSARELAGRTETRYSDVMSRPVIGLTTYAEEARFGLNDTFAAVLPLAYVQAVHNSGGRAVLITRRRRGVISTARPPLLCTACT